MIFPFFILFIILLRIGELILSRKNERWLLQHGGIEYGQKHYPFMVMLHVLFIISLIVEYFITGRTVCSQFLLILFFILLALKAWTIVSLGKFWNTKIYRVPHTPLIKKGPYKYVKHPNYIIVIAEIAIIPLIFHLYYTAIIFTVLNGLMLYYRIKIENKVLNFQYQFKNKEQPKVLVGRYCARSMELAVPWFLIADLKSATSNFGTASPEGRIMCYFCYQAGQSHYPYLEIVINFIYY